MPARRKCKPADEALLTSAASVVGLVLSPKATPHDRVIGPVQMIKKGSSKRRRRAKPPAKPKPRLYAPIRSFVVMDGYENRSEEIASPLLTPSRCSLGASGGRT